MNIATGITVWVIRDETKTEDKGLILPTTARIKPHTGTIIYVGSKVTESKIKNGKGKKAIFHKGVGQEIEYKGVNYTVLDENHIIGVD